MSVSAEMGTPGPPCCFSPGALLHSSVSQSQQDCHLGLHNSDAGGGAGVCVWREEAKEGVESVSCIAGGLAASLASSKCQ